jgi:hypothetical protein
MRDWKAVHIVTPYNIVGMAFDLSKAIYAWVLFMGFVHISCSGGCYLPNYKYFLQNSFNIHDLQRLDKLNPLQ